MPKIKRYILFTFFSTLIFTIFSLPAYARVKGLLVSSINSSGVLELSNSRKIVLAGIEMPSESLRLLPALVSGQKIELEFELDPSTRRANGISAAYLYVDTREIDIPVFEGVEPRENKVMLNELLVSMGAAKVNLAESFKHKKKLAQLQEASKVTGQGIWSYSEAAMKAAFEEKQ